MVAVFTPHGINSLLRDRIMDIRTGFKIFTHDWRSPLQGGDPVVTNPVFPFDLPKVTLNPDPLLECGAGWNYCKSIVEAARIASYWPKSYSANIVQVVGSPDAIEVKRKRRSSQLTIVRLCSDQEIHSSMWENVQSFGGVHTETLAQEQYYWYIALKRPNINQKLVEDSLQIALRKRGLDWSLKKYPSAQAAWDTRDTRDAWAAWYAWDAWAAWDTWAAWDAWDARAAWYACDAWAPWGALCLKTASLCFNLEQYPSDFLTIGIRDAYLNGLAAVGPTGPKELGFVMAS
jgi:hypothetical protein